MSERETSDTGTDHSTISAAQIKTFLSYVAAWLILGYAGFQFAGWTGAVLLPIGVTVGMTLLFAPFVVVLIGSGLIIHAIKACKRVRRYYDESH